jgi:uncharacterized Zn ribbon protein
MNRFIDISLMLVSGIIEASNDEGCIRENQHAVNKLRKERVFTQSGPMAEAAPAAEDAGAVVKDANGNVLSDGDSVVLIKDLKVKGSSITLKMGTKVKSIRLVAATMKWTARWTQAASCSRHAT